MARTQQFPHTLEELLGPRFERIERREIGAIDSVHEVGFGTFDGVDAVAKQFYSKSALQKAEREARIERMMTSWGMRTVTPIEVIKPPQPKSAVLVTEYIPGLKGGNTLTYNCNPGDIALGGMAIAVFSMTKSLAQLNAHRVTHGDPQLKNFAFLEEETGAGIFHKPFTIDLESGGIHGTKGKGVEMFETCVRKDLGTFAVSLGDRGFGGGNGDIAHDMLRDFVIEPYLNSEASEIVSTAGLVRATNFAHSELTRAREVSLEQSGHISTKAA